MAVPADHHGEVHGGRELQFLQSAGLRLGQLGRAAVRHLLVANDGVRRPGQFPAMSTLFSLELLQRRSIKTPIDSNFLRPKPRDSNFSDVSSARIENYERNLVLYQTKYRLVWY